MPIRIIHESTWGKRQMNKKTKTIIISIVVIIVLVAGGLGAYFGYYKPHEEAVKEYNAVVSSIQEKMIS